MTATTTPVGATVSIPASLPVVVGSPALTYKFDEEFQSKIVALCIRDTNFMQRAEGLVDPSYLEDVGNAYLANIANRYFAKYRKSPSDRVILMALVKHDQINKIIRKEHTPI